MQIEAVCYACPLNRFMKNNRSIFRPEALRRYQNGFERGELPRFGKPLHIALIWCLVGAGLVCTLAIGLARVPVYVSGYVAAKEASENAAPGQSATWIALTPARHLPLMQAGQTISFQDPANASKIKGVITQIETQALQVAGRPAQPQAKFREGDCPFPE